MPMSQIQPRGSESLTNVTPTAQNDMPGDSESTDTVAFSLRGPDTLSVLVLLRTGQDESFIFVSAQAAFAFAFFAGTPSIPHRPEL